MRMHRQSDQASLFLILFLSIILAVVWFQIREDKQDRELKKLNKILDNPEPEKPEQLGIIQRLDRLDKKLPAETDQAAAPDPKPKPVRARRRPRRQALDLANGDAQVGNVADIER